MYYTVLFYAPTIAQDWLLSRADINKLVKLKYYQAHNELMSMANVSVIDSDANRLDLSFSGSYPVKVSSLRGFEVLSRDMIRILSHAEIFSFAALNCLQSGNIDSRVFYGTLKSMSMAFMDSMATVQTLGLQQMRREAAIELAPKALLLQRQRESFALLHVPLSYC